MKTIFCSLFLIFILSVSAANAADDWTQKFTSPHPSARYDHAMAYIGEDKVLLFGGYDGAEDDETWVYDLSDNTWTQKFPSPHPSARYGHAMAYIGGDQVLLFGGYGDYDDTWVYDLSADTWTQKTPSPHPSARYEHAMAYIGEDQVLLFGGIMIDETWVYHLSADTWTQKTPSSKPTAGAFHGMAYIGGDQVLLFGGDETGVGPMDDTWVYDLSDNTWIQKTPSPKPSARYRHGMAYISGDQVLLFGGYDGSLYYYNDTWVYDLSDDIWIQDANTTQPSDRDGHGLSETSMDGTSYLVLFGGYDGSPDDETWSFGGGDYSLPVELSSFTAATDDGTVTLRWRTETEVNNIGFAIYRGEEKDGNYTRINFVPGAGSSAMPNDYQFTDKNVETGKTYFYYLEDVDIAGEKNRSKIIKVVVPPAQPIPKEFRLLQNFPNPFNPDTWLPYELAADAPVSIYIYNIRGQLVRQLNIGKQRAGSYITKDKAVYWNGRGECGEKVASGVYWYRLRAGQFNATRRMVILK